MEAVARLYALGDLLQIVRESVFEQRKATPERIIGMSLPDADQVPVIVDAEPLVQTEEASAMQ